MKRRMAITLTALVIASASVAGGIEKAVCDSSRMCKVPEKENVQELKSSDMSKMFYFSDTSYSPKEEENIAEYLSETKKIDNVKKTRAEWIQEGVLDSKYEVDYEGLGFWKGGGNILGGIFGVNSEIRIKLARGKGELIIDTRGPDLSFVKDGFYFSEYREQLNGKTNSCSISDSGYVLVYSTDSSLMQNEQDSLMSAVPITKKNNIDVIDRVLTLHRQFKPFLGTATYAELPLVVDGKERNVKVNVKQLAANWYTLSYLEPRPVKKGIVQVQEIHVLMYSPKGAEYGIPYKATIVTNEVKLHAKLKT